MSPAPTALVLSFSLAAFTVAEDSSLTVSDLEAYHRALTARPGAIAAPVRFRDLWDHPESYAGRPVRVEGRVARVFRQPRIGEFPPLAEAWILSAAGDPTCLVFPIAEGRPIPVVGASVGFTGTYLKRLKYQGGDVARVAPLIVGPEPPSATTGPAEVGASWSPVDWIMGLGAASVVAMALARRHLARKPSPPPPTGPPPRFVDGEGDPDPEVADEEGEARDQSR